MLAPPPPIGRAMTDAFAHEGARLLIADIELEPLHIAEHELQRAGVEVVAVQTDVAQSSNGIGQSLRPIWKFSRSY